MKLLELLPVVCLGAACATSPQLGNPPNGPSDTGSSEDWTRLDRLMNQEYLSSDGFSNSNAAACLTDPEAAGCRDWRAFAGALLGFAQRSPTDFFVQGTVVYALVRGGATDLALLVADGCRADDWWCDVLRGFAAAEAGDVIMAEAAFDSAIDEMPEAEQCEWTDIRPLLSTSAWAAFDGSTCARRTERLEAFWALTDPSWSIAGNDRKVEHFNRMAWSVLHDLRRTRNRGDGRRLNTFGSKWAAHHVEIMRYGMDYYGLFGRWGVPSPRSSWPDDLRCPGVENKWKSDCGGGKWWYMWSPYEPEAQAYRVVPDENAILRPTHSQAADWPLERDGSLEHYVPHGHELVTLADAQVAFFDRGDSVIVAAAAGYPSSGDFRDDRVSATLFLHTGTLTPPFATPGHGRDGRWTFLATAPRARYLVGIELVSDDVIARARFGHGLLYEVPAPVRLSDLLLYTPTDDVPPDSVEAAVPLMKPDQRWSQNSTMGVFLEVYGSGSVQSYPIRVELERQRGALAQIGEILGIGGARPVNVRWTRTSDGGRFVLSFNVDLRPVPPGDYTLRVSIAQPDSSAAVAERTVSVRR